ncbi:hypothetical protein SAY87_012077 [Trapa incisa]|uniref:Uncharacterized protein n=1 Tax=Trapa incisa TaxID=236973 RepID=A0AAN7JJG1_9MYRT|nr:hypothetical protein SAY87_012077 [Trapa incisa]
MAGCPLRSSDCAKGLSCTNLSFASNRAAKVQLHTSGGFTLQAAYSDGRRSGSANAFIGGFVLGGLLTRALGCAYAPQISKPLAGTDRKEMMKKLPKFIYDEDKALEKKCKVLAQKIAQLSSALDDVSTQVRPEDNPDGLASDFDEVEAAA